MVNGTEPRLEPLLAQLLDSEIIRPSSSLYAAETSTWAAQKNQHPQVVLRPSSTQSLAKILAHVSSTDLDISIRGSGNGSASAKDVLVSMAAFDEFDFDKESEILTLGAGQLWRDYYEKMEKVAPEYHGKILSARRPGLSAYLSLSMLIAILGFDYSGRRSYPRPECRRQHHRRRLLLARSTIRQHLGSRQLPRCRMRAPLGQSSLGIRRTRSPMGTAWRRRQFLRRHEIETPRIQVYARHLRWIYHRPATASRPRRHGHSGYATPRYRGRDSAASIHGLVCGD